MRPELIWKKVALLILRFNSFNWKGHKFASSWSLDFFSFHDRLGLVLDVFYRVHIVRWQNKQNKTLKSTTKYSKIKKKHLKKTKRENKTKYWKTKRLKTKQVIKKWTVQNRTQHSKIGQNLVKQGRA